MLCEEARSRRSMVQQHLIMAALHVPSFRFVIGSYQSNSDACKAPKLAEGSPILGKARTGLCDRPVEGTAPKHV